MTDNDISREIIGAIFDVYNELGPGLLESVYEEAMMYELQDRGLKANHQVEVPIIYKGRKIGEPLKMDILVENQFVIELKSVSKIEAVFYKQLYTYLRLSNHEAGILVNFNEKNIKNGIHRLNCKNFKPYHHDNNYHDDNNKSWYSD